MDSAGKAHFQYGIALEMPVARRWHRELSAAQDQADALACFDPADFGEGAGQARRSGKGGLVIIAGGDGAQQCVLVPQHLKGRRQRHALAFHHDAP